jgi:hypothetical protein
MLLVFTAGTVVPAVHADDPPAEPAPKKDAKDDKGEAKKDATSGKTVESDYVAKNFTLLTGAVILNPFKISKDANDPTLQTLATGSTEARAFIEGGYRRRWAWQDRVAPAKETATQLASAQEKVAALKKKRKELEKELKIAGLLKEATTQAEKQEGVNALVAEIAAAEKKAQDAKAADEKAQKEWRTQPLLQTLLGRAREQGWDALVDDGIDLVGRMGFVFDGNTSGAAGIAGGSDFYIEAVTGVNLARWTSRTRTAEETPTRFALNFEPAVSVSTDRDLLDTHQRIFVGPSLVIGFPFRLLEKSSEKKTDAETAKSTSTDSPEPIGELMLRAGGVRVEIPQFKDRDTRTIEVENEVADFDSEWGVGVDAEFNVPVTKSLGYLTARGSINMNMDPNPWSLTLGDTIPLSQFQKALLGG